MPTYRLIYQHRTTTEALTLVFDARRPCDARDEGRNNLAARQLDPIEWPLLSLSVVETT
jgi:hypothetical protein